MHRPHRHFEFARMICVLLAAGSLAPGVHADGLPHKTIRYGGDDAFMPFEWLDAQGRPLGFQVDLIRAVGRALNCEVTVELDTWSRTFSRLESGEIDVVAMYDQPSRRAFVDFSTAFEVGAGEIFIRRDGPSIRALSELSGREVIVQDRALAMQELPRLGVYPTFIPVASETEAILLLASGKHDCAIVTHHGGRYTMQRFRLTNLTTTFEPILTSNICFAVRKGDAETLELLNRGIEQLRADGTFNDLHQRWFGDFGAIGMPRGFVMREALWVVAPLAGLLALALVWNRSLRSSVARRTLELRAELAQRREVEAALRESEERLRVAITASQITVAHQDRDLRYTWVYNSPNGFETQMFLNTTDESLFGEEAGGKLTEAKRRVLAGGAGEQLEILVRTDGRPQWLRVVIEPLRDARSAIVGITSVLMDITALKLSEHQNIELERRVRQAQKLESLGLLAGGVAHDFSNLLTGVAGNTALALQDAPPGTRLRERIESIEEIARRARDLTQELLSLAGRRGGNLQRVQLPDLVRDTIGLFRAARQPATNIVFEPVAAEIPDIEINPTSVRQVVMNLLHNAADACEGRHGSILVRVGCVELTREQLQAAMVGADAPAGRFLFVEVEDSGAGIPQQILPRVFDPFYTTKPNGRGFGLAIVAGTMLRYHGAVFVDSRPERGTRIRLVFPSPQAPGVTTAHQKCDVRGGWLGAADAPSSSGGGILVVDDNDVVREMLIQGLRRAGYTVHASANAEQAETLLAGALDLRGAILDVNLEHGSGLDLLQRIRARNPELPVIVVTGGDDAQVRERLAGDSSAAFLPKPFVLQDLLQTLSMLLRPAANPGAVSL